MHKKIVTLFCSYICDTSDNNYYYCMYTSQVCSNVKEIGSESNCLLESKKWFNSYSECNNYLVNITSGLVSDDDDHDSDKHRTNNGTELQDTLPLLLSIAGCVIICCLYIVKKRWSNTRNKPPIQQHSS